MASSCCDCWINDWRFMGDASRKYSNASRKLKRDERFSRPFVCFGRKIHPDDAKNFRKERRINDYFFINFDCYFIVRNRGQDF